MTDNTASTASTQHPMWRVTVGDDGAYRVCKSSAKTETLEPVRLIDHQSHWLRAPTASAALARAEALRAGKITSGVTENPAPVVTGAMQTVAGAPEGRQIDATPDTHTKTIRVRACIAVVNGKQWAVAGNYEFNDAQMNETAMDVAGWFSGDNVQIDFVSVDVPLRQPAEITGAVEPPKEAP